tara:strand:+ start:1758 stop:2342 length:585 start_codon:yes stop_codon:yes gene_type:complete
MILSIFGSPVIVLQNEKDLFTDELYNIAIEKLMLPQNKNVNHPYARGGKICSTDLDITSFDDFTNLLDKLKQIGKQYVEVFSSKPNLKFNNMWINLTYEGCEIKNHWDRYSTDDGKSLIILFYPKAPTGGSNLVFMHNSEYGKWSTDYQDTDSVKLTIEEGDIVIMDNTILHAVDKHSTNEPRMCFATEFDFIL